MTLMENDGDREVKRAVGERSKAVAGRAAPVGADVAFQTLMTGLGVRFYTAVAGGG